MNNVSLENSADNPARIVTCDGRFVTVCHYRHATKAAQAAIAAGGKSCEVLSSNGKEVVARIYV